MCFLALFPGERGGGGGCGTIGIAIYLGEYQMKKFLTSSSVESLILFNKEEWDNWEGRVGCIGS